MSSELDRYSEGARRVLILAHKEAERLKHDHIGTHHLLVAMMRAEDSIAGRVLQGLGLDPESVTKITEQQVDESRHSPSGISLSSETEALLWKATNEATRMGDDHVGTAHLLLAVISLRKGPGSYVLQQAGVSTSQVRRQLLGILHEARIHKRDQPQTLQKPSVIQCPKDAIQLDSKFVSGVQAFQCPQCGGLFVRKDTLRKLYELISSTLPAALSPVNLGPSEEVQSPLLCPDDNSEMVLRIYKEAEVDLCTQCGSVWLEKDELQLIWAIYEEGSGPGLVPVSQDSRRPPVREFIEIIPETVKFVFESIMDLAEELIRWRGGQ
jgi:Zn-finger nucleic acid-binding protein